jgi:membrane-bound lytic murein transglycosylase D
MLKTQLSKVFCFLLVYFVISSFVPVPAPLLSSSDESADSEAPFVPAIQSGVTSMGPKAKLNKQELHFAKLYLKESADCLVGVSQRSKTPFTIMDSVFSRYGLPVELKYLAVIESELKPSALSRVGALGPWQLMPETAHDLGLKITRKNDERTNYYKSTRAAARYLKDLYAQFGDWLLVVAAYNAGPLPVETAIHKSGSRNFWVLQNYLPAETRGHVKRFIATQYYFEERGAATASTTHPIASISEITDFSAWKWTYKNEKNGNEKEPREVQFKRLMQRSAESLQKANKTMAG